MSSPSLPKDTQGGQSQPPRVYNEDGSPGLELSALNTPKPRTRQLPRLNITSGRMSYQPLNSHDPDENKSYGSTDTTPAQSPTALLIAGGEGSEDFEKAETGNPFLDPETATYWKGVYENCDYECRHVFDPKLTWTTREEQQLVRKLDWRVCLWAV
jgi:hypothetical protein